MPVAHFWPQVPPQSTSASPVSLLWLSQRLLTQRLFEHTPLPQSVPEAQPFERPHFSQVGPPQSMPVSCWFLRPSPQPGITQRFVLPLHTLPGWQSLVSAQ